jgi:hypothetical protein
VFTGVRIKMIISINNINLFAFVIDMRPIFFQVGNEFLHIIYWNTMLEDSATENGLQEVQLKWLSASI